MVMTMMKKKIVGLMYLILVSWNRALSLAYHHTVTAAAFPPITSPKWIIRASPARFPLLLRGPIGGIAMVGTHQNHRKNDWNSYAEIKALLMIDMKFAMKTKNPNLLNAVKSMQAALQLREIELKSESGASMNQEAVISVLEKLVKQRKESITCFEGGNHAELLASEREEKGTIEKYMPSAIDEAELTKLITDTIAIEGATSVKDIGKVIRALKPLLSGRADMSEVSGSIRKILSST